MKVLLIILDGLADRQAEELGGKTPLQAAQTPNLDKLALLSSSGIMHPISPGIAPSSELAHFILFGYPISEFPGRGYLEALGEGQSVDEDEIVLRASFVTVEEKGATLEIVGREDPTLEAQSDLSQGVEDEEISGVKIRFVLTGGRQGLLFLKGSVSSNITDADPFADNLPVIQIQALENAPDAKEAEKTADVLNQFLLRTYLRIKDRPLNFLVTKWAGRKASLDYFWEKYGFKGASIASGPLYKGLAKVVGLDHFDTEEKVRPEEDLLRRFDRAQKVMEEGYDFVYVHSKAADQAAHTKKPSLKREKIEELDRAFSTILKEEAFKQDALVVITSDHSTPSQGGLIHSGEPVPLLMLGKNVGQDEVKEFNEVSCLKGALGQVLGRDLMPLILNYTDRIRLSGSQPYSKKDFLARPSHPRLIPLRLK